MIRCYLLKKQSSADQKSWHGLAINGLSFNSISRHHLMMIQVFDAVYLTPRESKTLGEFS